MEKDAAEIMWKRSIAEKGMRYTVILSDGDAKTHAHLNEIRVHGLEVAIEKEECVNHISKRLGTGLRNTVKDWRARGVTLGGRKEGSLKEATITRLTNYYRHAIVNNIPDVRKIKQAIFATLRHYMSTDTSPQHGSCPKGVSSWCFYNKQHAEGKPPDSHNKMSCKRSPQVVNKIMPLYQRLASDQLLQRCTKGRTQNPNEALHSIVWTYCPKEIFMSKMKIDMGVLMAMMEFNMGCEKILEVIHRIRGESISSSALSISKQRDLIRRVLYGSLPGFGCIVCF